MAQRSEPSASAALYPHLPSAERPERQQRTPNIADAIFPSLSREAKGKEAARQRWDAWRERDRQALLRALRQINGRGRR